MIQRNSVKQVLLLFSFLFLTGILTAEAEPTRPNVIVFLVDDMGWFDTSLPFYYVGDEPVNPRHDYDHYGETRSIRMNSFYRTPNMERLAAQGVQFTRGYANPVCSPTRVSFLTGQAAARHGVTSYLNARGTDTGQGATVEGWRSTGIDESFQNRLLPLLLRDAGYHTIYAGKGHVGSQDSLGSDPGRMGFDVVIGKPVGGSPESFIPPYNGETDREYPGLEDYQDGDVYLTEALTREAAKAISTAAEAREPFFLYMSHYAVHFPWAPDKRFTENYEMHEGAYLDYATMIEGMDKSLGDLMDHLETLGIAEHTLILFASDNGSANPLGDGQPVLREKKGSLYEGGIRVPMLAGWARPAEDDPLQDQFPVARGSRTEAIAHVRDFYPTILDLTGLDSPDSVAGISLLSVLAEPQTAPTDRQLGIHFPHGRGEARDAGTIWLSGNWKLIRRWLTDETELFHIATDIQEEQDLSNLLPEKTLELEEQMAEWIEQTGALTNVIALPQKK